MKLPSDIDGVPVCYLCLDGGVDEAGQHVRRDCACRGTDAGFVHLSCLANYAATKSKGVRDKDMKSFINPWEFCPSCHQKYQNELRIDIATEFASFVRQQYPRDTKKQVEALYVKLCAFTSMLNRLTPIQKREAGVTANVLLSLINRLKGDAPLTRRYSQFEADAYCTHGLIAIDEGTKESARRAVVHFENQLEVCEAIGFARGVATAKSNIAIAQSMYEGDNSNEEVLKASQELYELCVAEYGEEIEYTIRAGRNYAFHLRKANRLDETRELLTKLLVTSKQVLGSDHNTAKSIKAMLEMVVAEHEIVNRG
jgi:hypothetical protein